MLTDVRKARFVFVGNRASVYVRMRELGIDPILTFAKPDSFLSRYLDSKGIAYRRLPSKSDFVQEIASLDFDYFLSNGLAYIMPVSRLANGTGKKFVNVHPSCLPDLKGRHPVNGAVLFGRDAGATCHYMDDGVDTGRIISRVRIPYSDDLDAALLYRLTFPAEADAFQLAVERGFEVDEHIEDRADALYYSIREGDDEINLTQDVRSVLARVRAFASVNHYAKIDIAGTVVKVVSARQITNPYFVGKYKALRSGDEALRYERSIVFRCGDGFVCFDVNGGEFK